MPFFARPNLDNEQFKQIQGTTLTLSGQTQIATVSGFTLTDGTGNNIPVIATGGTNYDVLTYLNGKILLEPVSGITGNAYSGNSPTTCTVGGLISGTSINGCSISCIIQDMVAPPLNPTITSPSIGFTISPSNILYEVGSTISVTGCTVFDRGCITPAYCGTCSKRSGSAVCYEYNVWGVPTCTVSSLPNNSTSFTPYQAAPGSVNTLTSRTWYSSGCTPAYNSQGSEYSAALSSGCTPTSTITITGIYPYYYGKVASGNVAAGLNRPSATAALITGGTKVVCSSNNTICLNFNSTSDDYIWFATPAASITKTCWYVDSANNGIISGGTTVGGNLFPAPVTVNGVANVCWSGQSYKLYISNYQTTSNKIIELRNN
jgi:hypothetical protein